MLLSGICAACCSRQTAGPDDGNMIRLPLARQGEVTPAELIAHYRYVPLGETRQPVGAIDQVLVTDDRIVVVDKDRSQTVFIFDHSGKPCAEISRLGRGPQEYSHLEHVALVPGDKPQLALLDGRVRKVLFYDLDGNFVRSMPIPFRFDGMEYISKDEVLCYSNAYFIRNDPYTKGRNTGCSFLRTIRFGSKRAHCRIGRKKE